MESGQLGKKKRSQSEKIGRIKYNNQLLKQILEEIHEIKTIQRKLEQGLKSSLKFEQYELEPIICKDSTDSYMIQVLYEAGSVGVKPSDISLKMLNYKIQLNRFQVTRRFIQMNKRLSKELGEKVAEKRGFTWVLTPFMLDSWRTI